jgi:tripartite-type tricarboxylate transporter receptor subunit TctC
VLLAPKGTPKAIVDQVNADVAKAVADPEVRERFAAFGYEAWPLTPAETAAAMEADTKRYADIIKRLNLQLD